MEWLQGRGTHLDLLDKLVDARLADLEQRHPKQAGRYYPEPPGGPVSRLDHSRDDRHAGLLRVRQTGA